MSVPQKTLEPPLRFPEFSGAWEEKRLGELGMFLGGGTPDTNIASHWNGDIPWVSSSDLTEGSVTTINISRSISTEALTDSATKLIPSDSLLIVSRVGVGKFAVSKAELCTSQDFCNFTPHKDNVLFIAYSMTCNKNRLLSLCQGTSIKGLTSIDLKNLKINLSYPKEQQKIADYLGAVDAKLRLLERRRDALRNYKKGMMQRIFSQEIRFTQDDGTAFPDWQERRLGDVANIIGGGTPSTNEPSYWEGGISWFTPSEIKSKYLGKSARTLSAIGLKKSSAKLLPSGTLLLSTRANVGDIGIATSECTTNQGFQSLIVKIDQSNEYWYYWIMSNKRKFIRWAAGSTFLEINKTEVSKIPVESPHPDEQVKIADFLSAIDAKITAATRQITAMQDFKKSMLQQMFV